MWVTFIEDFIPESVQLVHAVVVLEWESIGTFVSCLVFTVESGLAMERLVDISVVVDQQTKGIRLCSVFIVWILRGDMRVNVRLEIRISIFAAKPGHKVWNADGQVLGLIWNDVV